MSEVRALKRLTKKQIRDLQFQSAHEDARRLRAEIAELREQINAVLQEKRYGTAR